MRWWQASYCSFKSNVSSLRLFAMEFNCNLALFSCGLMRQTRLPVNSSIDDQLNITRAEMTFRLTDQLSLHLVQSLDRPKGNQSIGKPSAASSQSIMWCQSRDRFQSNSVNVIVHAVFETTHSNPSGTEKCRSAMIFNKRSLNFILVYFFLVLFSSVIAIKTFHSTFSFHSIALSLYFSLGQSAARIDTYSIFVVFRGNIKR